MALFPDLIGTTLNYFKIGLNGIRLKFSGSGVVVRNSEDSADAPLTASQLNASSNRIQLNSDAAGAGSDWAYNLDRPSSGQTADITFVFPANLGTAGQVLGTNGTTTSWISAANTAACVSVDTTSIVAASSSSISMFTLPANAIALKIQVVIDESFDGAPTASVGITGQASLYLGANQIALTGAAGDIYEVNPAVAADGGSRELLISYSAGGATVGAARFLVYYTIPA